MGKSGNPPALDAGNRRFESCRADHIPNATRMVYMTERILLVGCGKMGKALLGGWIKKKGKLNTLTNEPCKCTVPRELYIISKHQYTCSLCNLSYALAWRDAVGITLQDDKVIKLQWLHFIPDKNLVHP